MLMYKYKNFVKEKTKKQIINKKYKQLNGRDQLQVAEIAMKKIEIYFTICNVTRNI